MSDSTSTSPLLASLWMAGAILSFAAMAVAGREIYAELNTFELLGYRSLFGLVIVLVMLWISRRGFGQVRTKAARLHMLRNVFHFAGQNFWFYGIAVIPMAQLVALEFTNPLWVVMLAPLMLGEKLSGAKITGVLIGFAGILIVARPGVSPLEAGHFAGLAAAIGFAFNTIFTRQISRSDTILCVLFWMTLSQTIMGFSIAAIAGITMFSAATAPWIAVLSVCGITAHYCLTSAIYHAPATIVAPMEFARLPVIAMVGMAIYDEPFEIAVLVGGAIILAGNVYVLNSERRQRRSRQATP